MRRLFIPAVFVALAIVYTYPLSTRAGTEALDLGPDTRLFLWTLGWDVHALSHSPASIFDANIFYPETSTLAFSEHQIGSALLAAPFVWASDNLLFSMNAVLVVSSVLTGLFAYVLGRQLGLTRAGAVMVGVLFLLTPPRFYRVGQLHLATVQWIPLCLALVHRYARAGSRRHLLGAAAVFWLQALSGGQSALFLALAGVCLLGYLACFGELRPASRMGVDFGLALGVSVVLNAPFLVPYLDVQSRLGLERSLSEAVEWSPNASSFLASPTHVHRALTGAFSAQSVVRDAKAHLFPGITPIVLALFAFVSTRSREPDDGTGRTSAGAGVTAMDGAIVALVLVSVAIEGSGGFRWSVFGLPVSATSGGRAALAALLLLVVRLALFRRRSFAFASRIARVRERLRIARRLPVAGGFYLVLFVVSLWVSLGPVAGLYSALYRLVPGFDFVRVPSRFTLLTVLALSVLAGFGFERIRTRVARIGLVVFALVELAAFPLPTTPYSIETSAMDDFLARSATAPVSVFPIPDPRDRIPAASRHSLYMLHSTSHFFPLVNGYSGFTPPFHDRLFRVLARFPDDAGMNELENLGVAYAVFHRSGYTDAEWESLSRKVDELSDRLELLASFEEGRVYRLTRSRPPIRENDD